MLASQVVRLEHIQGLDCVGEDNTIRVQVEQRNTRARPFVGKSLKSPRETQNGVVYDHKQDWAYLEQTQDWPRQSAFEGFPNNAP